MDLPATSIWLVVLGAVACGPEENRITDEPERYSAALCGAVESCGCARFFESTAACRDEMARRFRALLDDGLGFDPGCFEQVVDEKRLDDCAPVEYWSLQGNDLGLRCTIFRGKKSAGDPCENHLLDLPPFGVEECRDGLFCYSGVCQPTGQQPDAFPGDPCMPEPVGSCQHTRLGESDLYCSDAHTCEQSPTFGQPCDSPLICDIARGESPSHCQGSGSGGVGTCAPPVSPGDACAAHDWGSCSIGGWCDPSDSICKSAGPAVCMMSTFPNARPTTP